MVIAILIGGVTLITAIGYWTSRLGLWGILVVAAVLLVLFIAVLSLPELAWARLTTSHEAAARQRATTALEPQHAAGVGIRRQLLQGFIEGGVEGREERMAAAKDAVNDWYMHAQAEVERHVPSRLFQFTNDTGARTPLVYEGTTPEEAP